MPDTKPAIGNRVLLLVLILVLAGEVVRGVLDVRQLPEDRPPEVSAPPAQDLTSFAWENLTKALAGRPGGALLKPPKDASNPALNLVDPAVLAPRLLDDRVEMAAYLKAFPLADYQVATVASQGSFYVDVPDAIKDFLRRGRPWEPANDWFIQKLAQPSTVLLDVGAHIGTHTMALSRVAGPTGRVYAFEPQKKIFRELTRNLELNGATNVVPLRFALGDKPSIIEMDNVSDHNEGATGVGRGGDRAELRTLDSFGFRNVSFVKIDVEGFEGQVLEGSRETLTREHPVVLMEVQGGVAFDTAWPEQRAPLIHNIQLLESMGYFVVRVTVHDYLGLPLAPVK